jgi:hypothetical protein
MACSGKAKDTEHVWGDIKDAERVGQSLTAKGPYLGVFGFYSLAERT